MTIFGGCHLEREKETARRGDEEFYGRSSEGASPTRVRRLSALDQRIDLPRAYVSLYLTTVELDALSPALI